MCSVRGDTFNSRQWDKKACHITLGKQGVSDRNLKGKQGKLLGFAVQSPCSGLIGSNPRSPFGGGALGSGTSWAPLPPQHTVSITLYFIVLEI